MILDSTRGLRPLALLLALAAVCDAQETRRAGSSALAFREVDSPAGTGSQTPHLFVAPGGGAFMSWVERAGADAHVLRFARWEQGAWTSARTIAESGDALRGWFVNWADFPALVASGPDTLAAHSLVKHPDGDSPYAYDVWLTWSLDGGASWSPGYLAHDDDTASEHGFVSLVPWSAGRVHAVWLDGRATGGGHGGGGGGPKGAMTLRAAVLGASEVIEDEALLDERVCDCCQTGAARTPSGLVVAYRDRSEDEVRDISIVRRVGERWSEPEPLADDGWEIHGCPVDGPSVAALERRVAVAWFTGAHEEPTVKLALSSDEGAHFGAPISIDDGDPLGRADVELLANGDAVVCWIERTDAGAEIRLRRVTAAGELAGPSRTLTRTFATRSTGFPRIARLGDELLFAWTDASDPLRVRTGVVVP